MLAAKETYEFKAMGYTPSTRTCTVFKEKEKVHVHVHCIPCTKRKLSIAMKFLLNDSCSLWGDGEGGEWGGGGGWTQRVTCSWTTWLDHSLHELSLYSLKSSDVHVHSKYMSLLFGSCIVNQWVILRCYESLDWHIRAPSESLQCVWWGYCYLATSIIILKKTKRK